LFLLLVLFFGSVALAEENATTAAIVTDDMGRCVSIAGVPGRIVSLSPSNTEILFALGLGDRVVGVTKYCNYPSQVKELESSGKIEVVGGYVDPDIEKIISLRPDLVLAGQKHSRGAVPLLEKEGIPVFVIDSNNLNDIILSIKKVGQITGTGERASNLADNMESRIIDISDRISSPAKTRVLYIVWHDPVKTAGSGTFEDEIIEKAGGVNIFHDLSGYAEVDPEAIAVRNPGVIITCIGMGQGAYKSMIWAENEPVLNLTDARKNGRIYQAAGDVVTRAGPRIVDGLEMFAKFIHPEAF
jgi:iron complex transport system substrate-binding protein